MDGISSGERQKAFLARAVLQNPKVLFLDEPTNHLDPFAVESFWTNLLSARRKNSFEVLVTTHDLEFIRAHADWVYALSQGKPVFDGETKSFFERDWPKKIYSCTPQ